MTAIAVIMMFVSGCKKFLDVPPKDQVPQSTLFKDEQGFKDALIGVYLGMDKNRGTYGLYTTDLSMGMMSTLAYIMIMLRHQMSEWVAHFIIMWLTIFI